MSRRCAGPHILPGGEPSAGFVDCTGSTWWRHVDDVKPLTNASWLLFCNMVAGSGVVERYVYLTADRQPTTDLASAAYMVWTVTMCGDRRRYLSAWEPATLFSHGSLTHCDGGRCWGAVGTAQMSREVEALRGGSPERVALVGKLRTVATTLARNLILAAHPGAADLGTWEGREFALPPLAARVDQATSRPTPAER